MAHAGTFYHDSRPFLERTRLKAMTKYLPFKIVRSNDPAISPEAVAGMNRFARDVGLMGEGVGYEQVVATQFRDAWAS
jgi:hypothetical protein